MAKPHALKDMDADAFAAVWMRHEIPLSRIAATLGVSHQALSGRARRMGLPSRENNCGGPKPQGIGPDTPGQPPQADHAGAVARDRDRPAMA